MRAVRPARPSDRRAGRRVPPRGGVRRTALALIATTATIGSAVLGAVPAGAAGTGPSAAGSDAGSPAPQAASGVAARGGGTGLLTGAPAAAPSRAAVSIPVPVAPVVLPAAIESTPAYVPQRTCDAVTKPGVAKLRDLLLATYPGSRNLGTATSCTGRGETSEHLEGRAFDWGVDIARPGEKAEADRFLGWLTAADGANARRMGVMYAIWDGRIWGAYAPRRGWRAISCSGKTACHRDHVHLSMTWDGAYARTSFWSGRVPVGQDFGPCIRSGQYIAPLHPATARNTTPCPAWRPLSPADKIFPILRANRNRNVSLHERSNAVAMAMWILGGEPATGISTALTGQHLAAFQLRRGLARTGTLTPQTWRSLAAYASGGTVVL